VMEDPFLDQLARVSAPVVIRALAPDRVDIVQLTEEQYAQYRNLLITQPLAVRPIDLTNAPYTVDLSTLAFSDVEDLKPLIGGKCGGFVGLLEPEDVTTPHRPICITVRAYAEHLAPFRTRLQQMLANQDFASFSRTRTLVLEGPQAYSQKFPSAQDAVYRDAVLARPQGDLLGDLAREGGVQTIIRDAPINPTTLAVITQALTEVYGIYDVTQGLRFRSSSSVEDIEGFNGAGLYTSNTGFLNAAALPDPSDHNRTVERALKETWLSYWGMEAFEERRLERVDHLSGNMAAQVHARFDDDKELANGVFTFTILPPGFAEAAVMEVNTQIGSLSITNPPPGVNAQAEVVRVSLAPLATEPIIERLIESSEVQPGVQIMDDPKLIRMFLEARAVTSNWMVVDNAPLFLSQRRRTLTLDFEFREMAATWPLLTTGNQYGRRVVIKQARTLEPGIGHIPETVRNYALPRDVLARAQRIERRICTTDRFRITMTDAYTDPLLTPNLGHDVEPFTGSMILEVLQSITELNLGAGHRTSLAHTAFVGIAHPGMREGGDWALDATLSSGPAVSAGFDHLQMRTDQTYVISLGAVSATGSWATCVQTLIYSTPSEFLKQFLPD